MPRALGANWETLRQGEGDGGWLPKEGMSLNSQRALLMTAHGSRPGGGSEAVKGLHQRQSSRQDPAKLQRL